MMEHWDKFAHIVQAVVTAGSTIVGLIWYLSKKFAKIDHIDTCVHDLKDRFTQLEEKLEDHEVRIVRVEAARF